MYEVIRDIISIDKETVKMKQRYEDIIKEKENEIRKALQNLEKNYGKEIFLHENSNNPDDIKAILTQIEDTYVKNMDKLNKAYEDIKDKVLENIWNDLFLSKEGI